MCKFDAQENCGTVPERLRARRVPAFLSSQRWVALNNHKAVSLKISTVLRCYRVSVPIVWHNALLQFLGIKVCILIQLLQDYPSNAFKHIKSHGHKAQAALVLWAKSQKQIICIPKCEMHPSGKNKCS